MSEAASPVISSKKTFITEAVILAGLPAYVYLITFMYEFGYCAHFGIPKEFISPNLTTILICAVAIFFLFFTSINSIQLFTLPFMFFLQVTSKEKWSFIRPIISFNTLIVVLIVLLINVFGFSWRLFFWLVGGLIVFNLIPILASILLPMLFHKGTVKERLVKVASQPEAEDIVDIFTKRYGISALFYVILFTISVAFAWLIGYGEASNNKWFVTVASRPDTVVLKTYGDMMICAQFDRANKTISNELTILYMSKFDELHFLNEEIGPLAVKKKEKVGTSPAPMEVVMPTTTPMEATTPTPAPIEAVTPDK